MDLVTQGYMAWQAFSRGHGSVSQRLFWFGGSGQYQSKIQSTPQRVSTLSSNITGNKSRLISSMRISLVIFVHGA